MSVKDETYRKLLKEFSDYRWLLMEQCADRCLEIGDTKSEKGWRWLAKWKRWPSPRSHKGIQGFGWTFDDDLIRKMPHGLPYGLRVYLRSYQQLTYFVEECLEWVARGVGRAMENDCTFVKDYWMTQKMI